MERDQIPPRVRDARYVVQRHFSTCAICEGEICDQLLRYFELRKFSLDEIYSLIAQLEPHEKKYFEDKLLDILAAALSPPPATQNVNPEPPPQQGNVGPTTRSKAAKAQQQQQQQPLPHQQQQRQQQLPHQQLQQQQSRQQQQRQQQPPRQQRQQQPPHQQLQQQQLPHQQLQQPQPHHQQQQQQQLPNQQLQQPQPHHQQQQQQQLPNQQQQLQTPSPLPMGAGSSSSILPIGWKCWRGLTIKRKANLLIVQVSPNEFMEMYMDDGRKKARCSTQACKSMNVFYDVTGDKLVDDPRLRHHESCKKEVKEAVKIRKEQFERAFLLKISATMVPPELDEFKQEFEAKFGAARFAEIYGTQEEQTKFTDRIRNAVKSKVEKEEMEKIWKKIDNFNPDDLNVQANVSGREEDAEEIESSDAQINERLQNLALSDEGASSSTTTTAIATTTTTITTTTTTMPTKDIYFAPDDTWLKEKCLLLGCDFVTNVSIHRCSIENIHNFKVEKPADILVVDGDGHCGYRSLSVLITGVPDYHGVIRKAICKFIIDAERLDESKHIFTNAKKIANKKLKVNVNEPIIDDNMWMNDADLAAAAALLACNICVYTVDKKWQCYSPQTFETGRLLNSFKSNLPTLLIDNSKKGVGHFSPVINVRK